MEEKTVHIPNISCGHCIMTIKNELSELEGVRYIDGDPAEKNVVIRWEPPADWNTIRTTLKEIGYPPDE